MYRLKNRPNTTVEQKKIYKEEVIYQEALWNKIAVPVKLRKKCVTMPYDYNDEYAIFMQPNRISFDALVVSAILTLMHAY